MSLSLLVGTTVGLESFFVDIFQNIKNTNGLHMDERSLLNNFFEEILKTSSVDYSCNEIEDIQSAVLEMLERIAVKINERGLFNISRIEPCGSMAEKAALWKTYTEEDTENDTENYGMETVSEKYLEFDFLAVLAKTDDIKLLMQDCKGCNKVHGSLLNNTLLQKYGYIEMLRNSKWKGVDINNPEIIDEIFQREVCASIVSLCNCWTNQGEFYDSCFKLLPCISHTRKFYHSSAGCTECSISRASGTLKIAPGYYGTRGCKLILQWESKSSSLFAPVGYNINQTQNMKRFRIHIDFIAALETLQETQQGDKQTVDPKSFIVSKYCIWCINNMWRISGCIEEIKAIKNEFSMKHKKCYMILKYIFQTGEINNYNMKTVVLHHHTTCTDTSEDMVACVTTILQEIWDAYKRGHLQAYCRPVNILRNNYGRHTGYVFCAVLFSIYKLDSFKPYIEAFRKLVLENVFIWDNISCYWFYPPDYLP